ncbi:MAG: hypothetical protein LBD59_09325 [Prevotellaceae bacterium]|jgi:hypothetical protein|nr:hypothetical protein [Prevotellaceae bacterium]
MKTTIFVFAFLLAGLSGINAQHYHYEAEWKRIDSLINIYQPISAKKLLDNVLAAASRENNVPQMARAFIYQVNIHDFSEEDALFNNIVKIEEAIAKANCPLKNILHTVAADCYWDYYINNAVTVNKRLQNEVIVNDVRTWDYHTFLACWEEHHRAALDNMDMLKALPSNDFKDMMFKPDTAMNVFRPTLWDFLAFYIVDFYQIHDMMVVNPVKKFLPEASCFAPAEEFVNKEISSDIDSGSLKLRAINMMRRIIAFHIDRADTTALIDADLFRLDMVHKYCKLPTRDSLYLNSLYRLANKYSAHPSCAEITYRVALSLDRQGNAYNHYTNQAVQWKKKQAIEMIDDMIQKYPNSFGAKNCQYLKGNITKPYLIISTDNAALPDKPILANVSYKNISELYVRIIPVGFVEASKYNPNYSARKHENIDWYSYLYQQQKSPIEVKINLPDDGDFQPHSTDIALPRLKAGYYLIITSNDSLFNGNSIVLNENRIWVTSMSYITKSENNGSKTRIHVAHRETGLPMDGVSIKLYTLKHNGKTGNEYIPFTDMEFVTDRLGQAVIPYDNSKINEAFYFMLQRGREQYSDANIHWFSRDFHEESKPQTLFFLDRAIYRPGQTVYFKGLVMRYSADGTPSVVNKYHQTVKLQNVTGDKLAEIETVSNEFGSFTGSFIIPASILTGSMMIYAEKSLSRKNFRVENYKRPKFEAVFDTLKSAPRLGDNVTVAGYAKAYSGNAVDGAKVEWRVVRETIYPLWRWWWGAPNNSGSEQVANGVDTTDSKGKFELTFRAIPNNTANKNTHPVFRYKVIAQVSDINGETHSAETIVNVGYKSLIISTDFDKTVNRDSLRNISVSALNVNGKKPEINGKPQILNGTITINRLHEPGVLIPRNKQIENRPFISPETQPKRPDRFAMSREEFKQLFPFNVYDNEDDMKTWTVDKTVLDREFQCSVDSLNFILADAAKWKQGMYRINLLVSDNYGEQIEHSHFFRLVSFDTPEKPLSDGLIFEPLINAAQPDDVVKVLVGSAYNKAAVLFQLRGKDDSLLEERILHLNAGTQILDIPVKEKHRGNIFMSVNLIHNNFRHEDDFTVKIPYNNKNLDIKLASFRDRLSPGEADEWRITIKDIKNEPANAELLASMYDASLDAFVTNNLQFNPWRPTEYFSRWNTASFNTNNSMQAIVKPSTFKQSFRAYNSLYSGYHLSRVNPDDIVVTAFGSAKKSLSSKVAGLMVRGTASKSENKSMDFAEASAAYSASDDAYIAESQQTAEQLPENIPVRRNFNETAFFYPSLRANENGETVVNFTLPDALTRWHFQALAWTSDLKTGYIQKDIVAQRDLMIFTNMPRFVREGDTMMFNVKFTNIGEKPLDVATQLEFFDALTMKPINIYLDNKRGNSGLFYDDIHNNFADNRNIGNNTSNINQNYLVRQNDVHPDKQKTLNTKKGTHNDEQKTSETSSGYSQNSTKNINETQMMPTEMYEENEIYVRDTHENVSQNENTISGHSQSNAKEMKHNKINSPDIAENSQNGTVTPTDKSNEYKTLLGDDYDDVNQILGTVYDNSELLSEQILPETIKLAASNSQIKEWQLYIPKGLSAILYRIKASSGSSSDGEEGIIPVLSDRSLVTETMPFNIAGDKSKTFEFDRLIKSSSASKTLDNHSYTVEFTANPVWTAIQSLPYIMEYPHECAEQTFNRYYANALASHIASSNPKIKQILDMWSTLQPEALKSNLDKNPELKSILIEETPWVRDASTETEQRSRIALLFDVNKMKNELEVSKRKLYEMQNSSGAFSWFRGDINNRYITQLIVAGFGHLDKLTGNNNLIDINIVHRAIKYLDEVVIEDFDRLKETASKNGTDIYKENYLTAIIAHYLYARSFFPAISEGKAKEAIDFYIRQSETYWTKHSTYIKGMVALALHRKNNTAAKQIMQSLSETAIHSEQNGMYWKTETGWWWHKNPIETHALIIEAYSEIMDDRQSVEQLKLWLLKHKQTHNWKTTKATADAIYALLLQGENIIADNSMPTVTVGNNIITSSLISDNNIEAGTGYVKKVWNKSEINPEMGRITVSPEPNSRKLTWGAAYWQYFEDLDKIESADAGIKITKKLFIKTTTADGIKLEPVTDERPIRLGDRVTVSMEITAANEMEYVHLKDMRAAAFEPVNTLSGYRSQRALGYYESVGDASINFFISRLTKGVHIFEYDMFATQRGEFSNGIPTIQCMYAPEYCGHAKGERIKVE